ncbi:MULTISPECIES: hypothetical protein [Bacillaceae]|uniref:Uncharacterized protein n=1 Tax=Evansella alkalicola TaxID=745819 RepID=A0ABS6JR13_9BACI|nr:MULTISPECIES: hypothetical protein [Bacillaceae]MBU9720164.1 hypothetical protein [Bacillus alkalicola]
MLAVNEGRFQWKENKVAMNLVTTLLVVYTFFILMNAHVWSVSFNAVDYLLKPFILTPMFFLGLTAIQTWTSTAAHRIKVQTERYTFFDKTKMDKPQVIGVLLGLSLLVSYGATISINYLIGISFHPVEYLLKPMLIFPVIVLLLTLFVQWTKYAKNYLATFIRELITQYRTSILVLKRNESSFKASNERQLTNSEYSRAVVQAGTLKPKLKWAHSGKVACLIRGPTP